MSSTTVAAVQMISGPDVGANLRTARHWLTAAAEAGAGVAVLPENFSFMGRRDADKREVAERDGHGTVQDFLAETAATLRMWIVAGTTPISPAPGERVAAACLVYDAAGRRVARYDKMHLFDVDIPGREESYRESAHIAPGNRSQLVPTPAGLLGIAICYDMRFPELFRQLAAAGAEWFAVPAAFTVPTGEAHWHTLLRARAIENLSYVVAAAQGGTHANGRATYGHSLIADYWGRVLGEHESGEGLVTAVFDAAAQAETRRHFPVLAHRVL
jgi:nitrilase